MHTIRVAALQMQILLLLQKQQPPCEMEGRDMRNSEELSALGVKDEDLILIVCNAA
ncbi:unnamed protein product [Prunus armeniaca]|uniref:Ubiquitin-like domain-containing protein n=2 Tax=Prunus TaxID=3754 RepID=A0A6J5V4J7_PRUAR|nr:unnamed protein product [Prunus armeniaca]